MWWASTMPEESQKILVLLVVGIVFLVLLVVTLFILSKSAPDLITKVIETIKKGLENIF